MHLADFLREHRLLTATHLGCEHGVCGACTLLIDGAPARSCIAFAAACDGARVDTIEGLEHDPVMVRLRAAFTAEHATAVRLLHAGDAGDGARHRAAPAARRRGAHPAGTGRQSLSLHRLRRHRARHCAGARGIARSPAGCATADRAGPLRCFPGHGFADPGGSPGRRGDDASPARGRIFGDGLASGSESGADRGMRARRRTDRATRRRNRRRDCPRARPDAGALRRPCDVRLRPWVRRMGAGRGPRQVERHPAHGAGRRRAARRNPKRYRACAGGSILPAWPARAIRARGRGVGIRGRNRGGLCREPRRAARGSPAAVPARFGLGRLAFAVVRRWLQRLRTR